MYFKLVTLAAMSFRSRMPVGCSGGRWSLGESAETPCTGRFVSQAERHRLVSRDPGCNRQGLFSCFEELAHCCWIEAKSSGHRRWNSHHVLVPPGWHQHRDKNTNMSLPCLLPLLLVFSCQQDVTSLPHVLRSWSGIRVSGGSVNATLAIMADINDDEVGKKKKNPEKQTG